MHVPRLFPVSLASLVARYLASLHQTTHSLYPIRCGDILSLIYGGITMLAFPLFFVLMPFIILCGMILFAGKPSN